MSERDLTEIDWLPKLNAYCRQVGQTSKSTISQQTPDMNKPSYSYGTLIRMAINSTSERKMSLAEIYKWVVTHFSYYKYAGRSWKNSIRHNLSMSKHFVKVPRGEDDPGKGCYWTVDLSPDRFASKNQAHPNCATIKSKRKRQTIAVPPCYPEKHSNVQIQVEQYYPATSLRTFYNSQFTTNYNLFPIGCETTDSTTREFQEYSNFHNTKDCHLNTLSLGASSSSIIESAARSAGISLDEYSNKNISVATETDDINSELNTLQEISTYIPVSLEFNEMHLESSDIDFDWDLLIN